MKNDNFTEIYVDRWVDDNVEMQLRINAPHSTWKLIVKTGPDLWEYHKGAEVLLRDSRDKWRS